jgi:2-hydroxychromene-2-carboxylate isomerase
MARRVEFWFEFASTYTYPAAMRIEQMARAAGVELAWKPFLLGPIFKAQGWSDSPFNIYPAKGRYMWRDLERICLQYQIPLRRPSQFPRGSLLAARIASVHAEAGWLPDFVRRVFTANFADDRNIGDPAVIAAILKDLNLDVLKDGESPEAKARLRENTERARALGLFGAPSFVVRDELFWGNDRLEDALRHADRLG